jgi:proline iminopeptidase
VALAALLAAGAAGGQTLPTRQGMITLDHARLFYEVVGTGDPIIVIHGGPGLDHNYLRPGLDVLASSHSLVYYDQRGTGLSTADLDSVGINFDAFVGDVDTLRAALGYDQVTVLAHSWGALIGLEYARRYPDHIRALILMDPVEPGSTWKAETEQRIDSARTPADSAELAKLTSSEGFKARDPATVSEVYRLEFRPEFHDPARESALNLELSRATAENGPTVDSLLQASMGDTDWWSRLSSIQTPTLILHGRFDVTPLAMAQALADSLPHAQLKILDSGHFPFIEDSPGLTSAVSLFLQDLPH